MTVSVVLFDLGGVLVELQGPSALMRLSGHTRTREEVRASWQRCSAVKAFETGRISVQARRIGMQAELTHNAHEARVILEHRIYKELLLSR